MAESGRAGGSGRPGEWRGRWGFAVAACDRRKSSRTPLLQGQCELRGYARCREGARLYGLSDAKLALRDLATAAATDNGTVAMAAQAPNVNRPHTHQAPSAYTLANARQTTIARRGARSKATIVRIPNTPAPIHTVCATGPAAYRF